MFSFYSLKHIDTEHVKMYYINLPQGAKANL
jgi:hypothetical protein